MINKNTYYKLNPAFKNACISVSRANSGQYKLTKTDKSNGYYVPLKFEGITLNYPFKALFKSNNKLDNIKALNFSDAINCPSERLNLCQLCNNKLCYAKKGEVQASGTHKNGIPCINSQQSNILSSLCIQELKKDTNLFNKFGSYINKNFKALRFNKNGDFKDITDFKFLIKLCNLCDTVFYGYTARDDILNNININYSNLFLNGSNVMYTNRFKTTLNIKEYLNSPLKCVGDCPRCKKCYSLKNKTIYCLLHGAKTNIDKYFNTPKNRDFLIKWFNTNYNKLNLKESDLLKKEGLLSSLNQYLKNSIYKLEYVNYKELINHINVMGWD